MHVHVWRCNRLPTLSYPATWPCLTLLLLPSGCEVASREEALSTLFLERWLVAREWNVPVTFELLKKHASWRARKYPKGHVEEAWVADHLADEKVFLQVRQQPHAPRAHTHRRNVEG